jgi:hypothetical protein
MLYTWHTTVTCLQSSLPTTRLGRVVGSMDGGSSTFLRVLPGRARAGEGSGPSSCRRRLSHRSVPVGQREAARSATARCSTWPPTSRACLPDLACCPTPSTTPAFQSTHGAFSSPCVPLLCIILLLPAVAMIYIHATHTAP